MQTLSDTHVQEVPGARTALRGVAAGARVSSCHLHWRVLRGDSRAGAFAGHAAALQGPPCTLECLIARGVTEGRP